MITRDQLKELISYDPQTGICIRINVPKYQPYLTGKPAGSRRKDNRLVMKVNNKSKFMSHWIWLYMTGELPPKNMVIDHLDRDPSNDRWNNLRLATPQENMRNLSIGKSNKSGIPGVYFSKNKWTAQISLDEKQIYLGSYDTKENAIQARKTAELQYFGNFRPTL